MNIYVANLHPHIGEEHLKDAFSSYGEIESAKIIVDLATGASKGYGFVSMPNDEHARNAISGLAKTTDLGDSITVREANPAGAKRAPEQKRPSPPRQPTYQSESPKDGKIKFYNDAKGYGFIVYEERDIFFQRNGLYDPAGEPKNDQPVTFKTKTTPRGTVAVDIILK